MDTTGCPSPEQFGVPHSSWRKYQFESVQWALKTDGFAVLESPVGSGKTAISKAVSNRRSVVALMRTKSLQEQYGQLYGAAVLKGRGNYDCIHPEATSDAKCDECLFASKSMHSCSYSSQCEYLLQKFRALHSPFSVLNFSYWLLSKSFRESDIGVLFLDEAHNLSNVTLDFCGLRVDENRRRNWQLPQFPTITGATSGSLFTKVNPVDDALKWLHRARGALVEQYRQLQAYADTDERSRKRARRCENFGNSVRATIDALERCSEDWFIRSGEGTLTLGRESVPGFVARPLTARYHFPRYFCDGHAAVAMSATIGDPATFAQELGVKDYVARAVPSRWPPEARRVYLLDAPKMKYGSTHLDYEKQADVIAGALKECPKDWSGILHVTRKSEAPLLANRLARRGFQDRVWVPPQVATEEMSAAWEERKTRHPGSLMASWAHAEGFDGLEERICVVAKVPFPSLADSYERERFNYSKRTYLSRTAQKLQQESGRTRRGREQDYDTDQRVVFKIIECLNKETDGERRGLVCIADANWYRVKGYLSESFKEALTEWT